MKELTLTDLIDVRVLQQIQDGFSNYTGMAALTADADGFPVTEGSGFTEFCMNMTRKSLLGCERCKQCDKQGALVTLEQGKPAVYDCHAGLVDFAAPIMVHGRFMGSFIGGQIRTEKVNEQEMRNTAIELGIEPEPYIEAAKKTKRISRDRVEKAAEFLSEIAKVLSEMAVRNYHALEESHHMEHAARSQSVFMMDMSMQMKDNMMEWTNLVQQAVDSQDFEMMKTRMTELLNQSSAVYSSIGTTVDYFKMTDGDVELTETEYSVKDMISSLAGTVAEMAEEKGVELTLVIDENVPKRMLGDAGRIGAILNKLLRNSFVYAEKGKVQVSVSVEPDVYASILVISVADNGVGMSEEQERNVNEYLRGEDMQLFDSDEAVELGFSLMGFWIKRMSGVIRVESERGKGSTFTVKVPQLAIKEGAD
jgi:ligand-binding sensor protein/anti-sigma regulatory factor (Ser/Thr protein kinase)